MPRPATLPLVLSFVLMLPGFVSFQAHAATLCQERSTCMETQRFAANLVDFRTIKTNNAYRLANTTIRFTNKTEQVLILGYVDGSARVIDDQGNRYQIQSNRTDLKGLGVVTRNQFDPTFTLGPGESAEAVITTRWFSRSAIIGTVFDFDAAIREIEKTPGGHKLGREHVIRFSGLRDGMRGAPVAVNVASASGDVASGAADGDACGGNPACKVSGPVVATLTRLQPEAVQGNNQGIVVSVNFRNTSNAPMILNYKVDTGTLLDEHGQRYTVDSRRKTDVQGIPVATRNSASSQFQLAPGEARSANFRYTRFVGKTPVGNTFSADLAVEQYELLPSNQLKLVREHAFNFPAQRAGGAQDIGRALKELGNLFKK